MGFLALSGEDWDIACEVVTQARTLQVEERRELLKACIEGLANAIGNKMAERMAQMFRA